MSMTRLPEAPAARVEKPTRVPAALRDSGIREAAPTPGVRPEQLLLLQRRAGNAAVTQLLRPDTAEEEVQEVEAPDTELAPDRQTDETETSSGPPADDGADEPDATPADESDAPSGSAPDAPPSDSGEAPTGSASEAPGPDDSAESSPSDGSLSPQPQTVSELADESGVERALAAHDPTLAGEGTDAGAEEATVAPDERTEEAEPAVSAPSLAGLQQQQGAALAAISQSQQRVEGRASALTVQVGEAATTARRALMKAFVSSVASLAALRIKARTEASTAGVEADADLRARRKRQKAAGTAAKMAATVTLDGRLGASQGKVDDYLASRLDSSGQRTAAQMQKLKSVRDAAITGWADSSKPKETRRLADKAYSRLHGQSLDARLKIRLDLRKKVRDLKAEINAVRSESLVQFTATGLEIDKGIDSIGVDSGKGLVAGSAPFVAKGIEAQGWVDKITAAAADQGLRAGLVPALADLDALRRASLAAIAPVRRSAATMFGSFRAAVKQRFGGVMSVVAGVRGRRRMAEAQQVGLDFGSQIVAGAGRGARSVLDRVIGWAPRLLEAPAQIVEKADFGPLLEGARLLLGVHIATVRKRFVKAVDDLELLMAPLVATGATAMAGMAEKAGDSTSARIGEQLDKLEAKIQPALEGLERTATGFKPRLSKAVIALWDTWYESAWSYLTGALGGLLKAMWTLVEGLAMVIVAVVVIVIVVVVALVLFAGMAIGAAVTAVAGTVAAILAATVTAVVLTAMAVYAVYQAAKGGIRRWNRVTDDPLSTKEEIGSAGGEGVGDIAAEFIPIKLPKPLARLAKKAATRLRKPKALPDAVTTSPRPKEADWSTVLDDIDEADAGAGRTHALDEAGPRAGKADAVDDLDELDSGAGKADAVDDLDELDSGAGKADAVEAAPAPAPKAADDGPLSDLVGKDVAPDELARRTGIAQKDFDKFDGYFDQRGVVAEVRPAAVAAPGQLSRGAIAKPLPVKAKSVNKEIDIDYLGAHPGSEGLASVFPPTRPPNMSKIRETNPKLGREIDAAYKKRKAANETSTQDYAEYINGVDGRPPVLQIDPDTGVIRGLDPGSGKYKDFVSDYDLYNLRMKDGSPLTPEMYALVVADLQHMGLAQHGAHMNMKFDVGTAKFKEPAVQAMWEGIRDGHKRGPKGEPVVVFGDGAPRADWPKPKPQRVIPTDPVSSGRRAKDIKDDIADGDPDDDAER